MKEMPENITSDEFIAFWSKVIIGNQDECWEWTGNHIYDDNSGEYGIFSIRGERYLAHRLSYFMEYGELSTELFVCHKCDNPPCVNPKHLFTGTNTDNVRDMHSKGRWRYIQPRSGENNAFSKLTDENIREIRSVRAGYGTGRPLAIKFGVSDTVISLIRRHKAWKHIQ